MLPDVFFLPFPRPLSPAHAHHEEKYGWLARLTFSVPEWLSFTLYISVPEWLSITLYFSVPEWLSITLYISVPEWLPIVLYISVPELLSNTLYIACQYVCFMYYNSTYVTGA